MPNPPLESPGVARAAPLVVPCVACRRHIRTHAPTCQFCGAEHTPSPRVRRALGRSRLALAGGAALLVAACGSPSEGESAGDTTSGGGESSCSGEGSCSNGESSCAGEGDAQPSCAGVCGDHHNPVCDDDGENCVAPPYGAPPMEEALV